MTSPAIHQIDFSVENVGKTMQDTKRRIRWVYAIDTTDRHEVIFTWSTVSGKQVVTINGDTMLSQQWQRTVFNEQLLTTSGGRPIQLRLVCSRTAPIGANSNFRKYELLINDRPFFTYPRLDGKGCAVDADRPDRPMSILGLLYPGKYYTGDGGFSGSVTKRSRNGSSRSDNDATMALSEEDDEDIPALPPKLTEASSAASPDASSATSPDACSNRNDESIDAPFDEHE
mmetsp:Transcript_32670/g.72037  ORF Transcript_32670/g.72037 Transcript_32670/m.72037 type:complete len:229 (+) Transcript_32670:198-884(+)